MALDKTLLTTGEFGEMLGVSRCQAWRIVKGDEPRQFSPHGIKRVGPNYLIETWLAKKIAKERVK